LHGLRGTRREREVGERVKAMEGDRSFRQVARDGRRGRKRERDEREGKKRKEKRRKHKEREREREEKEK